MENVASVTYSNNPNNPEDPDEPYEEIPTKEVFVETDAPKVTILKQQAKVEKHLENRVTLRLIYYPSNLEIRLSIRSPQKIPELELQKVL